MTQDERITLAEWAIEQAKKKGASDAAVNIYYRREVEIGQRERKLEKLKESTQNSLNISLYVDGRYSGHRTNDMGKESLSKFIGEAVAATRYLGEDEYRRLPDPNLYPKNEGPDLKLNDPRQKSITPEERLQRARLLEESALGRSDKIISVSSGYSDAHIQSVRVHSNGFLGTSESTVFSGGVEVTVDDGNGGRPEDWSWATTRFHDDLPDAGELGEDAVKRALAKIGQKKIASGKYTMLVENRAASRLLAMWTGPLSGSNLQQNNSWLEGKLGQTVASEKFTMIDDPMIPAGLGSQFYDDDGLAAHKRTIIEKGVLNSYYIDNYYGKKLEMTPNGGSTSNLVFEYGNRSLEDLIQSIDRGILVNGFIGGNSNSTTGDFSFGITGHYIENGKRVHALNEMNISGNARELWGQLSELANDPYSYSAWRRPSMLFEDIHFSGI